MATGSHCHTKRKYVYTRWEETGFPKRVNHSVTSCSDEHDRGFMYSLGGFKGKGKVLSRVAGGLEQWPVLGRVPMDVVELNLDKKEWKKLYPLDDAEVVDVFEKPVVSPLFGSPDGGMPGRYAHSCVFFQGKIYLYGGRNDVRFFENVECFDPVTCQWSVIQAVNEYGEVLSDNDLPAGRYAHACSLDGNIMYIQGGTRKEWTGHYFTFAYTDDIYSFNLLSRTWHKENVVHHSFPLKRDFHTGQYLNGNFYVFGGKCEGGDIDDPGFYSYKYGNQKWTKLLMSGYSPLGRRSIQSVKYGEESIIYFGGFSSGLKIFYSDLFFMDTATNHVTNIEPFGLGPSPRRRVGFCLVGTDLIICGGVGRDNDKTDLITYNDMYILSLVPSLQFLCMGKIFNENISTDALPLTLKQSLHEMRCIQYRDSQKLCDDEDVQ